LLKILNSRVSA